MVNNKQEFKSPKLAYLGFLLQTFLKRPFGYVITALYIIYLAIILIIVPLSLHFEPLFVWHIGGFNMPIFNLFFIAGSTASIAVAIFRTGRDDGTDLNISAKPLTKNSTVILKTIVYLLIMLIVCLITVIIVTLIKPIFGVYNDTTNATGIEQDKYVGLILSVLVGNLVNMLFFGGLSVLISMIGGQVITIIGTLGVVFVMCLMNLLYPRIIKSSLDILTNKYDAEMLSYSCNTLNQINSKDAKPYNFAAIQCMTDDDWSEEYHYDTKEYWDLAGRESSREVANYIDFGRQLSSLYNAFGLDQSKLKQASMLVIGTNSAYNYSIDKTTWVGSDETITNENYPICFYTVSQKLGKRFPIVHLIGGDMTISSSNWYLYSTLFGIDFDSISYVSTLENGINIGPEIWRAYDKPWNRMCDLLLSNEEETFAKNLYATAKTEFDGKAESFALYAHNCIANAENNPFIKSGETYEDLPKRRQYEITAKIHLIWAVEAFKYQKNSIQETSGLQFPFKSQEVCSWYDSLTTSERKINNFNNYIFLRGIAIDDTAETFSRINTSSMSYAETFLNLYKYNVSNFYKMSNIVAIWTIISCCLFTGSIIVYKKTDFK